NAAELDFFIGPDYLVTLPAVELLPVTRLFSRCEEDESFRAQLFSKGSGRLLYEVLDDLFDYCFPILDKIGHKLDVVEDEIFEGRSEEVVRDISNVKQEIISYRKIIKPERSTLRLLERHVERFLPEELELYFDDIVDASERIWDILDNYKEVVEALEDTNESATSLERAKPDGARGPAEREAQSKPGRATMWDTTTGRVRADHAPHGSSHPANPLPYLTAGGLITSRLLPLVGQRRARSPTF